MQMLIDANVILRYLLGDDAEMADQAEAVIQAGAYTHPAAFAEVVYVLQGVYKVGRSEIRDVLTDLLDEISVSDQPVMVQALSLYADENIDFVDALLVAHSKMLGERVFTFDKKLKKLW